MAQYNSIAGLETLDIAILDEVVREGELNLQCQLGRAAAADQRAMSFAGVMFTVATALVGATAVLIRSAEPDLFFMVLAMVFAIAVGGAGLLMAGTARPMERSPMGNEPHNWTPRRWQIPAGATYDLFQARLSQLEVLQAAIDDNHALGVRNARHQKLAIWLAFGSTLCAAMLSLGALGVRSLHLGWPAWL